LNRFPRSLPKKKTEKRLLNNARRGQKEVRDKKKRVSIKGI